MRKKSARGAFVAGVVLNLVLLPAAKSVDNERISSDESVASDSGSEAAAPTERTDKTKADVTKYVLRYKFAEGDMIRYRSEKVAEQCLTVAGYKKTDRTRVEQVRRFQVRGLEDTGQASLVMQYESVFMSRQVDDDEPVVFRNDMKRSEIPKLFVGFADKLRGKAPKFSVMPTGVPRDEDDRIILPDPEDLAENKDLPETRFMLPLPESPLAVGDTWRYITCVKVRVTTELAREVRLLTTCRLVSVADGIARIKFSTSAMGRLKSVTEKAQLVSAMPRGYCLMDLEAGQITKRVIRNSGSVHGVQGPQTLLTYSSDAIEELITPTARVVQR
ncbi:MAG: hypothetical protein MK102_02515 [Fuerstiella sp.]|nr:hypothetical protein [Fuerstiella sp.]